jgi:hypothetical protein
VAADELKQTKIDVKMLILLQFLLHLFMWCHFNSMWIMEKLCLMNNMDIEKSKMNKKKIQYQSLVWTKDV